MQILLSKLKKDYPNIIFIEGEDYKWSHVGGFLTYEQNNPRALFVLHEVGHALLKHTTFSLDIDLLRQEREAWGVVSSTLAPKYGIMLDQDLIEGALDTYREWLHSRSLCPRCEQTGLQTKTSTYICINCRCSWRPNDARRCALRRYTIA